jgi:hypothetical protein
LQVGECAAAIRLVTPHVNCSGQLMQSLWPAGAIRAPRYIHGSTTSAEWVNTVRNAPAPWGEIETKKIIISTQRSALRALDNPQVPATYWDKVGLRFAGRPSSTPVELEASALAQALQCCRCLGQH